MVKWLAWCFVMLAAAQDPAVILAPTADATVQVGPLRIIGRAPGKATITLDGKPVTVTEPLPGIVHAEVKIAEGKHEVVIAGGGSEAKLTFQAGKPAAGSGGGFRAHPPGLVGCDTCHAVKNEVWSLKRATLAPVCGGCHEMAKFPVTHTHNTDILTDCQNCHLPHGSAARAHLQKPKQAVCGACHNWPL
jgi:predicted CXXCH cytochrome family protein